MLVWDLAGVHRALGHRREQIDPPGSILPAFASTTERVHVRKLLKMRLLALGDATFKRFDSPRLHSLLNPQPQPMPVPQPFRSGWGLGWGWEIDKSPCQVLNQYDARVRSRAA